MILTIIGIVSPTGIILWGFDRQRRNNKEKRTRFQQIAQLAVNIEEYVVSTKKGWVSIPSSLLDDFNRELNNFSKKYNANCEEIKLLRCFDRRIKESATNILCDARAKLCSKAIRDDLDQYKLKHQ